MNKTFLKSPPPANQKKIFEFFKTKPTIPSQSPAKQLRLTKSPAKQNDEVLDSSIINVSSDDDFQPKCMIGKKTIFKSKKLTKTRQHTTSSENAKKRKRNTSEDDAKKFLGTNPKIIVRPGKCKVQSSPIKSNSNDNIKIFTSTQKEVSQIENPKSKENCDILKSIENTDMKFLDDSDFMAEELNEIEKNCATSKCNANTDNLITVAKEISDELLNVSLNDSMNKYFEEEMQLNDELPVVHEEESLNLDNWQKCTILSVEVINYSISIKVKSVLSNAENSCLLKQTWAQIKLEVEQTVNILAKKTTDGYEINNDYGYIILCPSILVTGTALVGFMFCHRKSIISSTYGGYSGGNKVMTCGFLIHELLQESLKRNLSSVETIQNVCYELIHRRDTISKLYAVQMGTKETLEEIQPFAEKCVNFMQNYVNPPKSSLQKRDIKKGNWDGYITKINDIEENLWCPRLGLKGKIDISVEAMIKPKLTKNKTSKPQMIPLELKTGRATMSAEHQGQVAVYNMMLRELDFDSPSGLLLYLRENIIKEVELNRREERDLIILRNHLVSYLSKKAQVVKCKDSNLFDIENESPKFNIMLPELPPPLNNKRFCGNCEQLLVCSVLQSKPIEDCTIGSKNIQYDDFYKDNIKHLTPQHLQYFKHWNQAIQIEVCTRILNKPISDIWECTPTERENKGKALTNLIVKSAELENGFYKTLFISNGKIQNRNFLSSGLSEGNYLIVSSTDRVSIAAGFVMHINKYSIALALERNLMDRYQNCEFCVDFYDIESHDNVYLTSLTLLLQDNDDSKNLREIIIERRTPIFSNVVPKRITQFSSEIMKNLNLMQQKAIYRVFTTKNYLLINGMPGTGKTQTLVVLIEILFMLKKSILITSNTHSAVDNLLGKLLQSKRIDAKRILKIGSESRTSPLVKPCCENTLTKNCQTVEELEQFYNNISIVGVTCFGAYHSLLDRRKFDVCIVDESTQILQSIVIKPLLSAKIFILVGDPEQLPPIVQNDYAKQMGMEESLFERLFDSECIEHLTLQYRMNKTINTLANKLTYNGKLMCGNTKVTESCLTFTEPLIVKEKWLHCICDASLNNSVKFIDTGNTSDINIRYFKEFESKYPDIFIGYNFNINKVSNLCEAAIILRIVKIFVNGGIKINDIGIITPFQAQVKLLQIVMQNVDPSHKEKIEINTVDQFQGRDKQVILFSCTRNETAEYCILTDRRRLNVAITRAKMKLILIGNKDAMLAYKPFQKLFTCFEKHQLKNLIDKVENFSWENILDELSNEIKNNRNTFMV